MRRKALLIAASLFVLAGSAAADPTYQSAKRAQAAKGTRKECAKGKCKRVAVFQGHNAAKSTLRTDPLDKPSGEVWIYAENLAEEVHVNIYKDDGTFDDAAMAKLDDLFRCRQTGEVRAMRPELYEQLSRIQDHFDHKKAVLISGFRFAERNSSRHYHASAMDIRIPDISIRELYNYAETLDAGNMGIGIYPTSQFIHVDFRAPGEPSYRWTDYSGSGSGKAKKSKRPAGRTQPARKPVS